MAGDHRGSKLMGLSVQTQDGESLGTVKDIVVDEQGKITHVIVSYGGTLGFGNKLAAVPWEHASTMMSGDRLVLQKERLQGAPSFEEDQWPNLASSSWSAAADQYWQQQGSMRMKSAEAPGTSPMDSGTTTSPTTTPSSTTEQPSTTTEQKDRG